MWESRLRRAVGFTWKFLNCAGRPVSGGTEGAKAGTLTIFLGADESTLKQIKPILNCIGNTFYTFGSVGKGQEVKAVNQILVAGTYIAVAEAMVVFPTPPFPVNKTNLIKIIFQP